MNLLIYIALVEVEDGEEKELQSIFKQNTMLKN